MTVCKCDICGKEIKTANKTPDGYIEVRWIDNKYHYVENFDLCEGCVNEIIPNIRNTIRLAKKGITMI